MLNAECLVDVIPTSVLSLVVIMRNVIPAVLVFAVLMLTYRSLGQNPGPNEPVYRVNVRVEVVDAQVIHKKTKRVIRSLKREDFQVYEDNVAQEITSFSQDETPLSVVLLFDLTDSVRPVLKSLADGALQALQHLKPEDEVAVMTYAASARLIEGFTTDRELTVAAVARASRMKSDEAAFFNEGIFQAAAQLSRSKIPASRSVIIWLTDDVPNIPTEEIRMHYGRSLHGGDLHTEQEAMRQALQTDTVVCTLIKRSDISEMEDSRGSSSKVVERMLYPPGDVYKYAQATGGEVVESSGKKLQIKLAELIDDLRQRYTLSYHPSARKPAGRFCAIKIKLSPAVLKSYGRMVVAAKKGYYR